MTWKHTLITFLSDRNEKNLKVGIRQEWFSLYPEEKEEIYKFLYFTNQHKLFLYFFAIDLQSHANDLPWLYFSKLIELVELPFHSKILLEIVQALRQQREIQLDSSDIKNIIKKIKQKDRYDYLQMVSKRKQELLASARIAQSEGLLAQQADYIRELKKISPKEYKENILISSQDKQKANAAIAKIKRRRQQNKESSKFDFSEEELEIITNIHKQAEHMLKQGKGKANDFAFLFRSLGDLGKAIEFITSGEENDDKDWILLDYLTEGGQHLAVLDLCHRLKEKYSHNPDSLFSIYYSESISYWELGEKEKALNLMSQISSMRPNFKSANEILAQWQEDSFE